VRWVVARFGSEGVAVTTTIALCRERGSRDRLSSSALPRTAEELIDVSEEKFVSAQKRLLRPI
jgi:hypothetical protein